jgi:hypothetical protein
VSVAHTSLQKTIYSRRLCQMIKCHRSSIRELKLGLSRAILTSYFFLHELRAKHCYNFLCRPVFYLPPFQIFSSKPFSVADKMGWFTFVNPEECKTQYKTTIQCDIGYDNATRQFYVGNLKPRSFEPNPDIAGDGVSG